MKDEPIVLFKTQAEWHDWLDRNYSQQEGIWLLFAKKSSKKVSLTYPEAMEEALCYGWIDGLTHAHDEDFYALRYTPRRKTSVWSKVNIAKVEALIAAKRMQPSGFAVIETAKASGSWQNAYESSKDMTVPEDFQKELDKNPKAKEFFASLNKINIYTILFRIQTAKKPETRAARITNLIEKLNKGEKFH